MFTKEEGQKNRKEFWTAFGVYMRKHVSLFNHQNKWVNYNTNVQDVYFRTQFIGKNAVVTIDITHRQNDIRQLYFQQFQEFENLLKDQIGSELILNSDYYHNGKQICRIFIEKESVNINRKDDWKCIFEFFETNLVKLDEFWSDFSEVFKELEQLS